MLVIIHNLPSTSALARARHGTDALWGLTEQLLASAIDALNVANWQRTIVPGKSPPPKPKPVPRPGVKAKGKTVGKGAIPISQFDQWWESGGE